jgi:peroxiredoxin Q/BCP
MDAYRDQYATLFRNGIGVTLLAISADPVEELASWARERDYPFRLLSDSGGMAGRRYGAWDPRYQLDNRTLYVVAPGGTIRYVAAPFRELDPSAYQALRAAIDAAQPGAGPGVPSPTPGPGAPSGPRASPGSGGG